MTAPAAKQPTSPYSAERRKQIAHDLGEVFDAAIRRLRKEGKPIPPELLGEDPAP